MFSFSLLLVFPLPNDLFTEEKYQSETTLNLEIHAHEGRAEVGKGAEIPAP